MKIMKTLKSILIVLTLAFLTFSCNVNNEEEGEEILEEILEEVTGDIRYNTTGDIQFTTDGRTATYSNPTIIKRDGWTILFVRVAGSDNAIDEYFLAAFEGDTPGQYEDYDGNLQGSYSNGNYFYFVYSGSQHWSYNYREIKARSFLVTDFGENSGDRIAGSFEGIIVIDDGIEEDFHGSFDVTIAD